LADGVGEVVAGHGQAVAQAVAPPEQELRQQHPGVAAGPAHAGARHRFGHAGERGVAEIAQRLRDLAEREAEVRTGITVRDRKDVQPIQLVATRRHPVRRRE